MYQNITNTLLSIEYEVVLIVITESSKTPCMLTFN